MTTKKTGTKIKNFDPNALNVDSKKIATKTIKNTQEKEVKSKGEKRGKKLITPKHWVDAYIKLDPEVKEELAIYLVKNKEYSMSTLANEALIAMMKIKNKKG